MRIKIDPRTMTDSEIDLAFQSVGKALNVHAVVVAGMDTEGNQTSMGKQFKYIGQIIKSGGITIDLKGELYVLRTRELETLWSQTSDLQWTSGSQGIQTLDTSRLREMMRDVLKPMVSELVSDHKD